MTVGVVVEGVLLDDDTFTGLRRLVEVG